MTDEIRHLRVEVQVLERAVHRFEERLAGLREETIKGFDRMDILMSEQFGELLKLFGNVSDRLDAVETKADERHAELLAAIQGLKP